ncbi:MAG: DNA-binding protein [Planctomycetota bacterium]|nr:MAG: DNA-binding protein [Planctomycetota bacterium]
MDNARDLKADSVHFGEDGKSGGLAGNQANKGMLTEAVSEKLGGSRRQAARILDAVLDSVTELLTTKGRVAVKGFGTFERKIRKGRAYKHPVTGKSIEVADKLTILFKPSKNLIEATKKKPKEKGDPKKPAPVFQA